MSAIIQSEYKMSLKVASFDTDSADRIRLSAVLRYQQEAGEQHLGPAGLGWRDLSSHGIAFVASRWHAAIHRLPTLEEEVTLTTWHRNRKGPRFFRCYEWRDGAGNLLIEGVMQFALVSVTDHRLLRGDEFARLVPPEEAVRYWALIMPFSAMPIKPQGCFTPGNTFSTTAPPSSTTRAGVISCSRK